MCNMAWINPGSFATSVGWVVLCKGIWVSLSKARCLFLNYWVIAFGPTLLLMGSSFLVSLLVGIPMGIIMGLKQYSLTDYTLTVLAFFNLSIPNFFLALGTIYIFALKLDLLPTSGMQTIGAPFSISDRLLHLVLPTLVLGSFYAGIWARYARSSILEVLGQDYIRTARAKGLLEWTVIVRHAFRNALLPLVTVVTLSLPQLLGGAIIVETIFQWPGMGMLGWRGNDNA